MSGPVGSGLPVAFHAPLKAPDHPVPSGDRRMARLMLRALELAGFAPSVASALRSFDRTGDAVLQERLARQAGQEALALAERWRDLPAGVRPRLWFTYHCHYKAPDLLGPALADALAIPYVVAEGSRSAKHREGPWARWNAAADAALDRADLLLVMTERDRFALARDGRPGQRLVDLPPFLDLDDWPLRAPAPARDGPVRLIVVAMMRADVKRDSYLLLAEALRRLSAQDWTLDILGDGEARAQIEAAYRCFGDRVRFHGLIEDRAALHALYAQADLMLWPAIGEAYGVALMEAQAAGLPVVAGDHGGVRSVVTAGETGLLARPDGPAAFAEAVEDALARLRQDLLGNVQAYARYRQRHSLEAAAFVLRRELGALLEASHG